jgi:putative molybdopterin biosynthesis protein
LGFLPVQEEQYDLVVPNSRKERRAVRELRELLADPLIRRRLESLGLIVPTRGGT